MLFITSIDFPMTKYLLYLYKLVVVVLFYWQYTSYSSVVIHMYQFSSIRTNIFFPSIMIVSIDFRRHPSTRYRHLVSYLKAQARANCFTSGPPYQPPGAAASAWSGGFNRFDPGGSNETTAPERDPPGDPWNGGGPHAFPASSGMHHPQQQQQQHSLSRHHGSGGASTAWNGHVYAGSTAATAGMGTEGSVGGEDSGADGDSDGGGGGGGGSVR